MSILLVQCHKTLDGWLQVTRHVNGVLKKPFFRALVCGITGVTYSSVFRISVGAVEVVQ